MSRWLGSYSNTSMELLAAMPAIATAGVIAAATRTPAAALTATEIDAPLELSSVRS